MQGCLAAQASEVELPEGATIAELGRIAGVSPSDIAIIYLDGRHAEMSAVPPPKARAHSSLRWEGAGPRADPQGGTKD